MKNDPWIANLELQMISFWIFFYPKMVVHEDLFTQAILIVRCESPFMGVMKELRVKLVILMRRSKYRV